MKLLLTGSSGFIGSYFINHFDKKFGIVTFSFLKDNLDTLDLTKVDAIIHLSALVHQMGGASKEEYEKVNVTQTLNLAKKAKESGVKHFVFMSTVKVYGEETTNTYKEDTICKPEDDYGKSKLKAENALLQMEDDAFKVSIVRTPIVYGYGVKANIKNLVNMVSKISVLPFGEMNNRRSLVYIGNLTHLIKEIIQQHQSGIFLASDDEALSTTKLIKYIANALNKKVYLLKVPFFESFLRLAKPSFHKRLFGSLEVDNSQTKKVLGFKNPYSTEEGIKYMIKGEKA